MVRKQVVVLYGPPGVGKLTVGQALAPKTGLRLFHVHQLADLVNTVFDTGTKEFADTFAYLWLWLFKKLLAVSKRGVIVTLVYGVQTREGKKDDQFFSTIAQTADECRADIFFIKLRCSDPELEKRAQSKSRLKFNKITDLRTLKKLRQKYRVDDFIPGQDSTEIDTTKLSPGQAAAEIVNVLKSE